MDSATSPPGCCFAQLLEQLARVHDLEVGALRSEILSLRQRSGQVDFNLEGSKCQDFKLPQCFVIPPRPEHEAPGGDSPLCGASSLQPAIAQAPRPLDERPSVQGGGRVRISVEEPPASSVTLQVGSPQQRLRLSAPDQLASPTASTNSAAQLSLNDEPLRRWSTPEMSRSGGESPQASDSLSPPRARLMSSPAISRPDFHFASLPCESSGFTSKFLGGGDASADAPTTLAYRRPSVNSGSANGASELATHSLARQLIMDWASWNRKMQVLGAGILGGDARSIQRHCFRAWAHTVSMMKVKLQFDVLQVWDLHVDPDPKLKEAAYVMHQHRSKAKNYATKFQIPEVDHDDLPDADSSEQLSRRKRKLTRASSWDMSESAQFVMSPFSPKRITWDVLSMLMILCDIVVIPLSSFISDTDSTNALVFEWIELITVLWWTCDIIVSFFTGYVSQGREEVSFGRVVRHYLRTWFVLDLIAVVPDLVSLILANAYGHEKAVTGGRLLKVIRLVRMIRLVRLLKFKRVVTVISDRIDSEHTLLVFSILNFMLMLVVINHFVCTAWYAIGVAGRDAGGSNWLDTFDIAERSLGYRYTTSLHWSLTQFTPASINMQPTNTGERIFGIVIVLGGLMAMASFTGSVTSAITMLRDMHSSRSKQFWMLKRYLRQHNVNKNLAVRILRYCEYATSEAQETLNESKVGLLRMLTKDLRNALQYEVSFCSLLLHPLFQHLYQHARDSVNLLASEALTTKMLAHGESLFKLGTLAHHMHTVSSGTFLYMRFDEAVGEFDNESGAGKAILRKADWVCEAALWVKWHHLGMMWANGEASVVSVDAATFGIIFFSDPLARDIAVQYADHFAQQLSVTPCGALSDVTRWKKGIEGAKKAVSVSLHRRTTVKLTTKDLADNPEVDRIMSLARKEARLMEEDSEAQTPKLAGNVDDDESMVGAAASEERAPEAKWPHGRHVAEAAVEACVDESRGGHAAEAAAQPLVADGEEEAAQEAIERGHSWPSEVHARRSKKSTWKSTATAATAAGEEESRGRGGSSGEGDEGSGGGEYERGVPSVGIGVNSSMRVRVKL